MHGTCGQGTMIESLIGVAGKVGLAPGLLVHIGDLPECEIRMSVIDDDRDSLKQQVVKSIDEMQSRQGKDAVTWVNIDGVVNVELIASMDEHFNISPLVLEDILHAHQML